jgi:hypothetical protein
MTEQEIARMRIRDMDFAEIEQVEIDGIDWEDYPDFVDAYIVSATYMGVPLTDAQIDELNSDFYEFIYEKLQEKLF